LLILTAGVFLASPFFTTRFAEKKFLSFLRFVQAESGMKYQDLPSLAYSHPSLSLDFAQKPLKPRIYGSK
jgi:hypothetical protein